MRYPTILIHTSVKLVTQDSFEPIPAGWYILIHTSVKLVTKASALSLFAIADFNPHEREARDNSKSRPCSQGFYFNPHEREARDPCSARCPNLHTLILIHTSVKLVTDSGCY